MIGRSGECGYTPCARVSPQVRVIDLFREWDEDGDGEVTKEEFRKALPRLGLYATQEDMDELFDSFDADGGGLSLIHI